MFHFYFGGRDDDYARSTRGSGGWTVHIKYPFLVGIIWNGSCCFNDKVCKCLSLDGSTWFNFNTVICQLVGLVSHLGWLIPPLQDHFNRLTCSYSNSVRLKIWLQFPTSHDHSINDLLYFTVVGFGSTICITDVVYREFLSLSFNY